MELVWIDGKPYGTEEDLIDEIRRLLWIDGKPYGTEEDLIDEIRRLQKKIGALVDQLTGQNKQNYNWTKDPGEEDGA